MTMPLILRFPANPATRRRPLKPHAAASTSGSAALCTGVGPGGTVAEPAEGFTNLLALAAPLPLNSRA